MSFDHIPVMLEPLISKLNLQPGQSVIDCTLGGGGHCAKALEALGDQGSMLAFDKDPIAIAHAQKALAPALRRKQLEIRHSSFADIASACQQWCAGHGGVDAIYADLGVSSPQLDSAERGFSFMHDGPLDMRMNREQPLTAADLLCQSSPDKLADLFYRYGEEHKSRHFARKISERVQQKPFQTTGELADFIKSISPYRTRSRKHPATKIFQALRIAVNDELADVEKLLEQAPHLLKVGGRLAIITFHSLEDRLVKHSFQRLSGKRHESQDPLEHWRSQDDSAKGNEHESSFCLIKPFPVHVTDEELKANPRARSAKLRVLEKRSQPADRASLP